MKKRTLFVIILLCAMASCQKKSFTCECTNNTTGAVTRSFTVHASTIQSADVDCENGQQTDETCTAS